MKNDYFNLWRGDELAAQYSRELATLVAKTLRNLGYKASKRESIPDVIKKELFVSSFKKTDISFSHNWEIRAYISYPELFSEEEIEGICYHLRRGGFVARCKDYPNQRIEVEAGILIKGIIGAGDEE